MKSWTFNHITKLRIASLCFIYCHLEFSEPQFIAIDNCVFTESRHAYAISLLSTLASTFLLNISVCNCTFSSNNGGIHCDAASSIIYNGGINYDAASLIYIVDSLFVSNWRTDNGGAILVNCDYTDLLIERSQFINNTVTGEGGAIYSHGFYTYLIISSTVFQSNRALSGGAISAESFEIYDCKFRNNSANYSGGAIDSIAYVNSDTSWGASLAVQNTMFENNHCKEDGGAILLYILPSEVTIKVQGCKFKNNSAQNGGAIHLTLVYHILYDYGFELFTDVENNTLQENMAHKFGGAMYVCLLTMNHSSYIQSNTQIKSCNFSRNVANVSGGALYIENTVYHVMTVHFLNINFNRNQARDNAGALYWTCATLDCRANLNGGFIAIGNTTKYGGAMYVEGVDIRCTTDNATIKFTENIAESKVFIQNSHIIREKQKFTIIFAHNVVISAEGKGGAIYVQDTTSCFVPKCFIGFGKGIAREKLEFVNNSATHGPVLYGGVLDRCIPNIENQTLIGVNYFKQISTFEPTPLAITSDPVRICLCNSDSQIDCSIHKRNKHHQNERRNNQTNRSR